MQGAAGERGALVSFCAFGRTRRSLVGGTAAASLIAQRTADGLIACSVRTGGYCRARQRLPLEMVSTLTRQTSRLLSQKAPRRWRWRGRAVKLVDGTGLSMLDTPESQAMYPQPSSQAAGVGFALARLVMVICLASGVALDAAIGSHQGKSSGEFGLVRRLLERYAAGDVIARRCAVLQLFPDRRADDPRRGCAAQATRIAYHRLSARAVTGHARSHRAPAQAGDPSRMDDARATRVHPR